MHNKRLFTVSFLDCADVSVVVHIEDCEGVEGLDVLEGVDSLVVQVPEIPEEGRHQDLVLESFLEDAGRGGFLLGVKERFRILAFT